MKNIPGGLQNFLKQAQQMQSKMAKVQAELETMTVEAASGGGAVKAVMTCKPSLVSLSINKEVVSGGDVDMLQDLITAAVNEALAKSKETSSKEMEKVTGGMQIPGLF